jgi:hypothetical protein
MGGDIEVTDAGAIGQHEGERRPGAVVTPSGVEDVGDGASAPSASRSSASAVYSSELADGKGLGRPLRHTPIMCKMNVYANQSRHR